MLCQGILKLKSGFDGTQQRSFKLVATSWRLIGFRSKELRSLVTLRFHDLRSMLPRGAQREV